LKVVLSGNIELIIIPNHEKTLLCYFLLPVYFGFDGTGVTHQINGYLYVSQPYFRYKTMTMVVHKDAIPAALRQKLEVRSERVRSESP